MPREFDSTFIEQKNAETNKPLYLYTIYDYDGASNNLYLADYNKNIDYDGITYNAYVITHDTIGENSSAQIDAVALKVGNANRVISAYIQAYAWRGKKVSIKQLWWDELADTDAFTEDIYYIDNFVMDQLNVEFTLTSKLDIMEVTLPTRMYNRSYCSWLFKGTECGYAGGATECNRSWATCQGLDNQARFGGFPSVPGKRIST